MTRDQRLPRARAEAPSASLGTGSAEQSLTDAEVVKRIANGNVEALGTLYDRHARSVLGFVRRLASKEDAEDIVQNVFLRVVSCAARFDPSALSAKPWLIGIAVHISRERQRSVLRFAKALVRMSVLRPKQSEPATERTDLERALSKLSLPKREVLLLVEVEEFTCDEVASALGIPIGTVWTRLHHARRELRKALGEMP